MHTLHPSISFRSRLNVTYKNIEDRLRNEKEEEHKLIEGIKKSDLPEFLSANRKEFAFPTGSKYAGLQQEGVRSSSLPVGSSNYFVPDGEAALILYLMHEGLDVRKELSYIETI